MRESTFTLVYGGFIPSFPTKGQLAASWVRALLFFFGRGGSCHKFPHVCLFCSLCSLFFRHWREQKKNVRVDSTSNDRRLWSINGSSHWWTVRSYVLHLAMAQNSIVIYSVPISFFWYFHFQLYIYIYICRPSSLKCKCMSCVFERVQWNPLLGV